MEDVGRFNIDGFDCRVFERPDKLYLNFVYGHRKSDKMDFVPQMCFERDVEVDEIKAVCRAILDKSFVGMVERYGDVNIYVKAA